MGALKKSEPTGLSSPRSKIADSLSFSPFSWKQTLNHGISLKAPCLEACSDSPSPEQFWVFQVKDGRWAFWLTSHWQHWYSQDLSCNLLPLVPASGQQDPETLPYRQAVLCAIFVVPFSNKGSLSHPVGSNWKQGFGTSFSKDEARQSIEIAGFSLTRPLKEIRV